MDSTDPDREQAPSRISSESWQVIVKHLGLSTREAEIVWLIFDDKSEASIADRLHISAHTVHTHIERLYEKLGVRSRCQLMSRLFGEYVNMQSPETGIRVTQPINDGARSPRRR